MVDSRKGKTIANGLGDLPERVQVIEQKLDDFAVSVDGRFAQIDGRFAEMDGRFARLERKMDQIIDLHLPKTPKDGGPSIP